MQVQNRKTIVIVRDMDVTVTDFLAPVRVDFQPDEMVVKTISIRSGVLLSASLRSNIVSTVNGIIAPVYCTAAAANTTNIDLHYPVTAPIDGSYNFALYSTAAASAVITGQANDGMSIVLEFVKWK